MASVITVAFENWKAQEAASGKAVLLDEFVFANVPNLDPSQPIDRNEKLPPANQIVHRQAVNKAGLASENAVAYSVTLGAEVGNFDFNWIGLLNKASGTVAMITHAPTQKKLKTQNGQQGNVLTRSFILEFQGAAEETQIKTSAETWQIDFTARLSGIDEMQRLINVDSYGAAAFFNDGFEVTRSGEQYTVKKGLGYVGGLRGELAQNQILNGLRNTKVYADFSYQGNIVSQWNTVVKITPAATLNNYVDAFGFTHQVFAIASIDASGNVKDLRPMGGLSSQEISALETRFKLDLTKKIDKANITHQTGNSTELVASQQMVTTELGKKQPAGNYADGYIFSKLKDYTRMQSPSFAYRIVITDAGSFMMINDATSGQVFGFNASGELISGKIPVERLTGLSQTAGSSKTAVMSQDAATKAFQPAGNYASSDIFTVNSVFSAMRSPTEKYRVCMLDDGRLMVIDATVSSSPAILSFSASGEMMTGKVPFERLTGVSKDASGFVRTGNSTALTTAERTASLGTSTTLVATQKLVNDVNSKLIGVGQTWRHMHATGERKPNIVYTNDKGRAIEISVTYQAASGNTLAALSVKINGFLMARQVSRYESAEKAVNITMVIPSGATYEVTDVAGSLYLWAELS
ncbi:phage tail-collar fiber domain-containing protein [Providencia sp. PROV202]|uniref:phage tail-collar fiber domain-containing protein n=1 Tax=Providencia sp. PROV202 TaxID=2949902 RepID=UPI002349591A|nr:phage tail protein [Providencia sp. PROV202]